MSITIPSAKSPIDAKISVPGSKSITNRALLLAALAKGESFLENVLFSDDTTTLMVALRALGVLLDIDKVQHTVKVVGCSGRFPCSSASIHCQDAGTVARFLLVACANQMGVFTFDGSLRLRERPLGDLIQALRAQGVLISSESLPLQVNHQGFIKGGDIFVPSDISSQFLSGLLMMAPYFQTDTALYTKEIVSAPYVDMTCSMMRDFGIEVSHYQTAWRVKADQCYQARTYCIESDFSSASYFFAAAAATGGRVTLLNMRRENSVQGDSAFLDVLEKMGCKVESHDEGITLMGPSQLQGIEVDMQHMSDTMMTLAAIAPFAHSPTRIFNIGNTRVKESDRIFAMADNLRRLGIGVDEKETELTIYPGVPSAGIVKSYQDHRIAMACSLIGLKVPGIVIDDAMCVNKTFPGFFEVFVGMCR